MVPLPIDPFLPQITQALRQHRRLVVVAEPGAGKTTRVGPAILQSGMLQGPNNRIIMLQPRRVAARASANRIAFEHDWQLGNQVGYQVRGEKRLTEHTPLQILTEGILTRKLVQDPFLEGVGCVILDEFHERHIDSDLCIAMLREIAATVRDDLHILVMSATLDAQPVAVFLGDCPTLDVPGRMFPVQLRFAPPPPPAARHVLPQHIAGQIRNLLDEAPDDAGDILVFLPGMDEIRRTATALEGLAQSRDLAVLPLHGSLSFDAQSRVLDKLPQRKVILATNIAETSLTIDGVRTVIDSGLARVLVYDAQRGMDRLELRHISRANATQRMGRAGRTAPGRCIRLWSAAEDKNRKPFELPEIQRVDLCSPILHLHKWGKSDPRGFGWFQIPPEHAIASAQRTLTLLGALKDNDITPLGRQMLLIPAHPRLARIMIAAADAGLLEPAAAIAAILSEKDMLLYTTDFGQPVTRQTHGRSDILHRLWLLQMAEQSHFSHSLRDQQIDPSAARQVARTRDDLLRQARRLKTRANPAPDEDDLLKLILLAYPDRVCRRRDNNPDTATMVGGFGVKVDPSSIVVNAPFFVAVDARDDTRRGTREALSRLVSQIEPAWLEELFPHLLSTTRQVQCDPATGKVHATVTTRFVDLPLRQIQDANASPQDIADALAQVAQHQAPAIFATDEPSAKLLERLAFVRKHVPEQPWPLFDDARLGEILAQSCPGKRSIDQLKQQDLAGLIRAYIDYNQLRLLDQLAPESITVPSGSHIRVQYNGDRQPTLAVRLQEVFGWQQTPLIAAGRVSLLMHLLGPNYRPVQITSDLASFWTTAYFDVRKDLRTRYPKHAWPEDPLTAKPEAKGRPRSGQ